MNPETRERRLVQRREDILAEATSLFAEHGYSRAKVDDVALRLNLGKGTIYRYFPTKESLFLAVVDNALDNLLSRINSALDGTDDPFRRIESAIKAYLTFFDENLHLIEIFIHERAEFRDRNVPTYTVYRTSAIKRLEATLASLKAEGFVRDVNVQATASLLGDMIYGAIHSHAIRGERHKLASLAPLVIDIFFHGILTPGGKAAHKHRG